MLSARSWPPRAELRLQFLQLRFLIRGQNLRDFRVRPEWDGGNPRPLSPLNQKGLVDQFGKPKPAYTAVKRMFDEIVRVPMIGCAVPGAVPLSCDTSTINFSVISLLWWTRGSTSILMPMS